MGFFDYLLAGGVGAAQGYEARQERLRQEEEERKAQQRQAMYDTLQLLDRGALPSAQRQAVGQAAAGEIAKSISGAMGAFQSGAQTPFDAEAIARGAGRMGAPAAQFKVGDVTFDMPDLEQRRRGDKARENAEFERSISSFSDEEKRLARMARAGIPASALAPRQPRQPRRELIKETGQIVDIDTGEITTPKGYLVPRKATGAGGVKGPSAEDLLRAEAQWNSLTNIPDVQLKPEEVQFRNTMVRTFDKLRASPSGKGAPALNLIFQAVAAAEAQNKRLTAPPKAEGGDADADLAEARRQQAGRQGGVAPAPVQRPVVAPTAAPAAPKPPAEPASMADAAAKQASRAELWDKLKAQNPSLSDDEITARVMREIP